jgi:ribonuclease D
MVFHKTHIEISTTWEKSNNLANEILLEADRKLLRGERVVIGLDSEWNIARRGEELPRVALVQLAFDNQVFLFRLCLYGEDILRYGGGNLAQIFKREDILKVGRNITNDVNFLECTHPKAFCGQFSNSILDVKDMEKFVGLQPLTKPDSLNQFYLRYCDKSLIKDVTKSDWESTRLTDDQIRYAANDVVASRDIYYGIEKHINDRTTWEAYCHTLTKLPSPMLFFLKAGYKPGQRRFKKHVNEDFQLNFESVHNQLNNNVVDVTALTPPSRNRGDLEISSYLAHTR